MECVHQTHFVTTLACKLQMYTLKWASHLRQVCLVTGGNGFVGQNLVTKLVKDGTWKVVIFDIAPHFRPNDEIKGVHLVSEGLASGNVKYICGDLRKKEQVVAGEQNLFVAFRVGRRENVNDRFAEPLLLVCCVPILRPSESELNAGKEHPRCATRRLMQVIEALRS